MQSEGRVGDINNIREKEEFYSRIEIEKYEKRGLRKRLIFPSHTERQALFTGPEPSFIPKTKDQNHRACNQDKGKARRYCCIVQLETKQEKESDRKLTMLARVSVDMYVRFNLLLFDVVILRLYGLDAAAIYLSVCRFETGK